MYKYMDNYIKVCPSAYTTDKEPENIKHNITEENTKLLNDLSDKLYKGNQ